MERIEFINYADELNQRLGLGPIPLPYNDVRAKINRIISLHTNSPKIVNQKLAATAGVKTLEEREDNQAYRCAQYVFGKVHREPWALPYQSSEISISDHALWMHTTDFLRDKGFVEVRGPVQANDVVLYGCPVFGPAHFGVIAEREIHSKFGNSNIVAHPIDLVPSSYGSEISFFRKVG